MKKTIPIGFVLIAMLAAAPAVASDTNVAPATTSDTKAEPAAASDTKASTAVAPDTKAEPATAPDTNAAPAATPDTKVSTAVTPDTKAATAAASDTRISLGIQLWSNAWKETVRAKDGSVRDFNNGTALMAGPSLGIRFWKNWFANATYLTTYGDYESSNWYASGDKMEFKRTDEDFLAGYLINDPFNDLKIGFFAEYKSIKAPASYTNQASGLDNVDAGTWKLWGPGLGVLAEKHLDESTLLYGNIAYLLLQQEFAFSSGAVSRFDTNGFAVEVGVAHTFTNAVSVNAGIKFQRINGDKDNGDDVTDTFSGLTAGISYTF